MNDAEEAIDRLLHAIADWHERLAAKYHELNLRSDFSGLGFAVEVRQVALGRPKNDAWQDIQALEAIPRALEISSWVDGEVGDRGAASWQLAAVRDKGGWLVSRQLWLNATGESEVVGELPDSRYPSSTHLAESLPTLLDELFALELASVA